MRVPLPHLNLLFPQGIEAHNQNSNPALDQQAYNAA